MTVNWDIGAAMVTDPGCHRPLNEDSGCIVQPTEDAVRRERGVLVIVADGMGGHNAGEVASKIAVETIRTKYYGQNGTPVDETLHSSVEAANTAIYEHARGNPEQSGMGTTCVALAICGDHASVASVGDSRLYLVRAQGIYRMTVDDSAVGDLVRQGVISSEEAKKRDDRNVLTRALGTHESVAIYKWDEPLPLREGDVFVLCSDGLTDLVSDEEILQHASTAHPADAAKTLVELSKSRGGYDNITAAVVRLNAAKAERAAVKATRETPLR